MSGLWDVPGLPPHLSRLYAKLSKGRRLVQVGRSKLIVYPGNLNGEATQVAELIAKGYAYREKIGKRRVLILGTWTIGEKRFTDKRTVVSEVFTEEMLGHLSRYSESVQRVVEDAFVVFGALRKTKIVSPKVLLRQLEDYKRFSVDAVEEGLKRYLNGNHAEEGKGERYALGIVRGVARDLDSGRYVPEVPSTAPVKPPVSKQEERVEEKRLKQVLRQQLIDQRVTQMIEIDGLDIRCLVPQAVARYRKRAERELNAT